MPQARVNADAIVSVGYQIIELKAGVVVEGDLAAYLLADSSLDLTELADDASDAPSARTTRRRARAADASTS